MKFEMTGERQMEAIEKFPRVHQKAEWRYGKQKKMFIYYLLFLIILIVTAIFEPWLRIAIYVGFGLGLGIVAIFLIISYLNKKNQKKRNSENRITTIEFEFEDKIQLAVTYQNGSVEKGTYFYEDIKKIVETEEFFFLYIEQIVAIPVDKIEIENKEEFIDLFIKRGIKIKEVMKK